MQRPAFHLFVALLIALPAVAQDATGYAEITGNNVRLKAGPEDFNAEVGRVNQGDVVRVVGKSGNWIEAQPPGGFDCYVKKRLGSRTYVELKAPGEGLVVVTDLQIRPRPSVDWPSLGELAANQRVTILGEEPGDWYRILSPENETVFIWGDYVRTGGDQAALAARFAEQAAKGDHPSAAAAIPTPAAPTARNTGGAVAAPRGGELDGRLASADADLQTALGQSAGVAQLAAIRSRYELIAAEAPEGSRNQAQARSKVEYVREREELAGRIEAAESRIRDLDTARSRTEKTYVESLSTYRTQKIEEVAAREGSKVPKRFLELGIGNIHPDFLDSVQEEPTFVLTKGAQKRYLLTSARYDLSEYVDHLIGITGWTRVSEGDDPRLPRIIVTRLEVLD